MSDEWPERHGCLALLLGTAGLWVLLVVLVKLLLAVTS